MRETVIKVEKLSKQYRLGEVGTGSMKDDIKRWRYKMMGWEDPFFTIGEENDRTIKSNNKYVWALRDINFEVKQGDILGIIGRNGAGKSTLLKILSRTTGPTIGSVKMKGRIASLLEVGTGFHGELSGRENIFLNGTIMGMRKTEIQRKLEEIIDFAGVEKYIDTPVKRYSSGMYVRLAFGVAAHLDPDIMIVDEVLAVGDAEFQKKALGKMKAVSKEEGRTVIFVSHNMASIQYLCTTGLLMDNGKLICTDNIDRVVSSYLKSNSSDPTILLIDRIDRLGNGKFKFTSVTLQDENREVVDFLQTGGNFKLNLSFESQVKNVKELKIGVGINNQYGERIAHLNNEMTNQLFKNIKLSSGAIEISLPRLPLKHGRYAVSLFASIDAEVADWIQEAIFIDVEQGDFYSTGNLLPEGQGDFLLDHNFDIISTFGK